jgi:hypothetical protein
VDATGSILESVEEDVEGWRGSMMEEERDSILEVRRGATASGARGCDSGELERVPWRVGYIVEVGTVADVVGGTSC